MIGSAGGWLTWALFNGSVGAIFLFFISLITRRFLRGTALVAVTTLLVLPLVLVGLGAGMAESDFTLAVVLPHVLLLFVMAALWLVLIKTKGRKG